MASRPNSNGVTCRNRAAISGMASADTWVPNWLIVSPVHSFMNSRCRHSDGRLAGVVGGVTLAAVIER